MKKILPGALLFLVFTGCGVKKPVDVSPTESVLNATAEKSTEVEETKPSVVVEPNMDVSAKDLVVKNFKHSDHQKVIKEYGCIPCHHFNYEMHIPDVKKAKVVSKKLLTPSKVACSACHKGEK